MDESVMSTEEIDYIDEPNEIQASDNEVIDDNVENIDEDSSCKSTDSTHDESETIECNICGKLYKRKAHLLRHLMSHKGESDFGGNNYRKRHYIFVCNKCGRRFSKSKTLQNHENEGSCVEQEVSFCFVQAAWNFMEFGHSERKWRKKCSENINVSTAEEIYT